MTRRFIHQLGYAAYLACRQIGWMMGSTSPIGATLKLTARCTLKCPHCPWLKNRGEDLPTVRWKEIISQLRQFGVRHLVFEGGEPTLRPDLQELVEFGQSKRMVVTIATNGTFPLGGYSPDQFLVSVDGLPDSHDSIRGAGSFNRMQENVRTTSRSKIALISLSTLNVHQMEDILECCEGLFDACWFSFVYDYEGGKSMMLGTAEKKEAAARILSLLPRYPIINKPCFLRNVGVPRPCRDWLLYTVTSDGEIHRGCMVHAVDSCRCDQCELACHRELSDFIDPARYPRHLFEFFRQRGSAGTT